MSNGSFHSTAEHRRGIVVASAVHVFAERGYHSTPIAAVAEHAGISPAYVFKLFPGKVALFTAALEEGYAQVDAALQMGAERESSADPDDILHAMGGAYAELITDRDLLKLQVHALSAVEVPAIAEAVRAGMAHVVRRVKARSGASDAAVQRFIAWGQLCHLVVSLNLTDASDDWARVISAGLRHPEAAPTDTRRGQAEVH